ncbi:MAG: lysophospholipid acyltransferase family protein [Leptospiraceae bacterium]|nr:lysophospholipid acyltransferase family protein [Leptospiraceae bacterium]
MKFILASFLVSFIVRFWYFFIRLKETIHPESKKIIEEKKPFILAGYHSFILTLLYPVNTTLQKKMKRPLTPLVSYSKDGELINQTFLRFGMVSVRGSSSKGGASALKAIIKKIKNGFVPIFTPDGPRGPIYQVQPGVIQIASMTGAPIVAVCPSFDRHYEARSWDKHKFPKFGSTQWIDYTEPIYIPKGLDEKGIQRYAKELEVKMIEQKDKLDQIAKDYAINKDKP